MKHFRFSAMLLLVMTLAFIACNGSSDGSDTGSGSGDNVISIAAISGVTPPNYGETPVTTITETNQFTGTVSWSDSPVTFDAATVYTATITLTAKTGFTFNGVAENFFTVPGAAVTNPANSSTITAVFAATGESSDIPVTFSGVIANGTSGTITTTELTLSFDVDPTTLTEDNITVTGATKGVLIGTGTTRTLAVSTITVADGATVSVTITSPEGYAITGSPQAAVVYKAPSVITISAIPGVVVPSTNTSPLTTAIDTFQYSGTITWSPVNDPFVVSTVYTANIVLIAKTGWTLTGVAANFFKVAGAATVTNPVNSGTITAVFPATEAAFVMSGNGGTAGNNQSFTKGTLVFNMKYVPGGTFPTGTGTQTLSTDSGANPATVSTPYWIAETEVTYELWYKVYTWATTNYNSSGKRVDGGVLYSFTFTSGFEPRAGNNGTPGSETASQEPVTYVNWRQAMVWCNALTEYYNANNGTDADLDCVYYIDSGYTTPIRTATDSFTITWDSGVGTNDGKEDDPFVKTTAKGFRLPGSMEWECAARYKDGTNWTAGDWASGGTGAYTDTFDNDYANFNPFAWFGNTITFPPIYGSSIGNTTTTQPVGLKTENSLGIHDMSGNVWELCFDWNPGCSGSYRIVRGGSFLDSAGELQLGFEFVSYPYDESETLGFRFARTVP